MVGFVFDKIKTVIGNVFFYFAFRRIGKRANYLAVIPLRLNSRRARKRSASEKIEQKSFYAVGKVMRRSDFIAKALLDCRVKTIVTRYARALFDSVAVFFGKFYAVEIIRFQRHRKSFAQICDEQAVFFRCLSSYAVFDVHSLNENAEFVFNG